MKSKRRYSFCGLLAAVFLVAEAGFSFILAQTPSPAAESFVYDDHGLRDPLWRLVSPAGVILTHENDLTFGDLELEGILAESGGQSLAIINGRVLKAGEMLGAFTVQNVTSEAVMLLRGKDIFMLKLKKEE